MVRDELADHLRLEPRRLRDTFVAAPYILAFPKNPGDENAKRVMVADAEGELSDLDLLPVLLPNKEPPPRAPRLHGQHWQHGQPRRGRRPRRAVEELEDREHLR